MKDKSESLYDRNKEKDLLTTDEEKINLEKSQKNKKDFNKTKNEEKNEYVDSENNEKDDSNKQNIESKLNDEIEGLRDERLRLLAEMENLRKRLEKEKIDSIKYGSSNFARDILSLGDNLSRALNSIPSDVEKSGSLKNLVDGLKMVEKEFIAILKRHGVEKVEAMNKKFDHNFHQAMLEVETDETAEGIVVQEIQPGFIMYDRLLRPSMVGVSKKLLKAKKNQKSD